MNPDITQSRQGGPVIQFSIFADNKVGRLNDLTMLLASNDLQILALCSLDTTDSSIVRMVVNYPEQARELFAKHGYTSNEANVIAVEIDSEEYLRQVTCALVQAEINIHYIYPFVMRPHGKTGLVIRLEDNELARDVLTRNQVRVLTQADIAR
ncbi:MAG TPA: acetolactate synthase [Opitutae bacterium]|nr:acetolactate synthase [Opitutae bacterium]